MAEIVEKAEFVDQQNSFSQIIRIAEIYAKWSLLCMYKLYIPGAKEKRSAKLQEEMWFLWYLRIVSMFEFPIIGEGSDISLN